MRAVGQTEKRLKEAARLGFKRGIMAAWGPRKLPKNIGMQVVGAASVRSAIEAAFVGSEDRSL